MVAVWMRDDNVGNVVGFVAEAAESLRKNLFSVVARTAGVYEYRALTVLDEVRCDVVGRPGYLELQTEDAVYPSPFDATFLFGIGISTHRCSSKYNST
jgi:hypothetical protein